MAVSDRMLLPMDALKGICQGIVYLDFDGTVHHEAVYWDPVRKPPSTSPHS